MKQIPLTQGKFALVDDEDYEFLMQWEWYYEVSTGYACSRGYPTRAMHRVLNKTPKGIDTDHRDTDKLNNQRYNLRDATKAQNQMNSKSAKGSSSKYKGVSLYKRDNVWVVMIHPNRKAIYLGRFPIDQEKEAALAYNKAAIEHFGEYALLNQV